MPAPVRVILATGLPPGALALHPGFEGADLTLSFAGRRRNVIFDPGRLVKLLGCDLPDRLWDLLEIALTVYVADIAFPRGENEDWVRHTSLLVPVREVELWREIEPQLAEFLYVLSHDSYAFEFVGRAEGQRPTAQAEKRRTNHDCVALLSGGIDSFAGATMLLATGRQPLFVAHRAQNPAIVTAQERVRKALARRFEREVELAAVSCGPVKSTDTEYPYPPPEQRETSQRTRSFFFLSLGAVACHAVGAKVLFCPENGVLALNLPLTEARVGGYSTASTRPRTLARFAKLLAALGVEVRVDNPFVYQTKAQLTRDVLRPHFSTAEIQSAVSCWMAGRSARPCGGCVPCLIRAITMEIAGLPREAHMIDPLTTGSTTGPESAARANLVDLLTFTHRFRSLDDDELLRAYPVLLELPPEVSIRAAVAMLRRFAEEATAVLEG